MQRSSKIEFSDELLAGLGLSPEQFVQQVKLLAASKLYELGKITSGQAAGFCGFERVEFLLALSQLGMSGSNMVPDDAETELDFALHG